MTADSTTGALAVQVEPPQAVDEHSCQQYRPGEGGPDDEGSHGGDPRRHNQGGANSIERSKHGTDITVSW